MKSGKKKAAPQGAPQTGLVIERMPLADLRPAPYNPRKDLQPGDPDYEKIRRSVERWGMVEPLVWNRRSGNLVGGHQRLKVLLARGDAEGDVSVVDLDEQEEAALNVALNKTGGDWDMAKLSDLLSELDGNGFDATLTGFDEDELKDLLTWTPGNDREEAEDVDLEPPEEPKSKRGEVYQLGRHRLMCGDATDAASWDAIGIVRPAMVFTSPPYGVGENAKLRDHYVPGAADRVSLYAEHDDRPEEWLHLMMDWTGLALAYSDVVVCNVQMLANNKRAIVEWMHELRSHIVDVAVWDKNGGPPQMQANVLTNAFEWMVVMSPAQNASRSVPLADFHGSIQNIVRVDPRGTNEFADVHRAVMPIGLAEWALALCPKARHVVDPFGGSGTTLIAAEQAGRTAYLMEVSPGYCDVIRRRYAEYVNDPSLAP